MTGRSPALPWRTRIFVSILSAVTDAARCSDGTVRRRLISLVDFKVPSNPSPVKGVRTYDVTVDASRDLWFRLFVPTGGDAARSDDDAKIPVIVFFHGGGFTFLGPDSRAYDAVCRRFARTFTAAVVSVNYRLSPEHRYPSQYDDGFDVLRFLDDGGAGSLLENADVGRCFLAGDSAGGNICHHVALRACGGRGGGGGGGHRLRKVRVVGVVAIQPFLGGEERTESEIRLPGAPLVSVDRTDWLWKAFLPEGSDRDHEAANVCGPNSPDIRDLDFPATLVFVGGMDPLQDWQRRYYEWLKRSGKEAHLVEYPEAIHAFYIFPELPEAPLLFSEVRDFIRSHPPPPRPPSSSSSSEK